MVIACVRIYTYFNGRCVCVCVCERERERERGRERERDGREIKKSFFEAITKICIFTRQQEKK